MAQLSLANVPIGDDWGLIAQWGPFDKVDVLALGGSVLLQFAYAGTWQPGPAGKLIRGGLPVSLPGLSAVYPPGPTAVQAKRAQLGVGATLDIDLYQPEG